MTFALEMTQKEILVDMHGRLKTLEAHVEQLLANERAHAEQWDRMVAMQRTLIAHVTRLMRQKEVLLEAVGRTALDARYVPTLGDLAS
jgi:hypothetical protein